MLIRWTYVVEVFTVCTLTLNPYCHFVVIVLSTIQPKMWWWLWTWLWQWCSHPSPLFPTILKGGGGEFELMCHMHGWRGLGWHWHILHQILFYFYSNFYLSCSILILKRSCSVAPTLKFKPNIIFHSRKYEFLLLQVSSFTMRFFIQILIIHDNISLQICWYS
jgi:hypothetical protein